mmetsp:Transcript_55337/g.161527  ORF Transcript_55337/g.161527 Transcript_55337/m.161527 type:complete len:290 (+) Transcript_55337:79-948(+)
MALTAAAARAARALRKANALLVTAGAGMGVDSGLPDFRGTEGLWKEYPPLARFRLDFSDMANPRWFETDPCFAWGFYGHRLLLYRRTVPHEGFTVLHRWRDRLPRGCFVFTSNVDGQFQRAGFAEDDIVECHGSIHYLQSMEGGPIWSADGVNLPEIPSETLRLPEDACPRCPDGTLARPNILMFGDWAWDGSRTAEQRKRLHSWLNCLRTGAAASRLAVVELGAGEAVPTVRMASESAAESSNGTLIRINPRDSHVPSSFRGAEAVSLACGALEGLRLIDQELSKLGV